MAKKATATKKRPVVATVKKRKLGFKQRSDDSPRPQLEGFIKFSKYVLSVIRENKRVFLRLLFLYLVLSMFVIGFSQQTNYSGLSDTLQSYGEELGVGSGLISQSLALFGITLGGTLNTSLSGAQQIYIYGIFLAMWLVVVWILRYSLTGKVVKLRDAVYNAGAPVVASLLLLLLALVQLLPASLGLIAYSTATTNGLLKGVVEYGIFGAGAILLTALSLYWLMTTLFALVVVTVPGTYPMKAHRIAREIVLGQRLRMLTRLLWLGLQLLITWVIVLLPVVLLDAWINQAWLPLVVVAVQLLTAWSLIYGASYVYLLYRRMIDEPATS